MNRAVTGVTPARATWSSSLATRLARLTQIRRAQLELILAVALYLGFACYLTWPLITDLAHSIYGEPGDPYGTMAFFGNLVSHHRNPFLPGTVTQFAAPEGIPIPWPRDLASAPEVLSLYLLTAVFGEIAAFGLYSLAGYTLTGVVTFLFARRLTKDTWAALIAGWVFAFYPFAAINGRGHPDFVQGWVLVLAIWRLLELLWHPSTRNGLLAGLAVVLGMWWSPYFILFVGVAYAAITAAALLRAWRDGSLRLVFKPQLTAALVIAVFMVGLGVLSTFGGTEGIGVRTHSTYELGFFAARPLEYLLPDIQSPLFGGTTKHYLSAYPLNGTGVETTLYVGITVILLALVAFVAFIRRKLTPLAGPAVLALWLVAIVAAITSLSPKAHIFGVLLPFPSHFISLVTTTWRVYSRFVMIVMLALSVLAAVGLTVLTRGRSFWVRIAVMSLATIAIPLDLWAPQGGHVEKIPTPGIYKILARQPMGMVAEYPLARANTNVYGDIFFQRIYNKPLINGYVKGSFQELRAYSLAVLANPSTAPRLAALGVRYVIVDATPPTWGWPPSGQPGAGFRLIAHEPYADLYAVTLRPKNAAVATTGEGFANALPTKTGISSWLKELTGTIELDGICTICNGMLRISLESYGQPHYVTIFDRHGRRLAHGSVSGSTEVNIPIRFAKRETLRLTATPGPQPVNEAPVNLSASVSVSVRVFNLEFSGGGRLSTRAAQRSREHGKAP
jgi:hypothetical protein